MLKSLSTCGRQPRPRDFHGRSGAARRLLALPFLGLVAAAMLLIAPALASADTASTLTVIGTSDVSDSGLIPNVIQPGFQKAYPQYTFKYIGTGTGNAIAQAESGAAGASNLIVHAASLENQFVPGGYSYEQYGRALWTNDFVLAGANADPAGVVANAPNNIAQAFADVAAAGINGGGTPKATFVSRGGTPGTTVAEHAIWQLVSSSGLAPAGLLLCTVSSANGGGETPIAAGNGVNASGQPCPSSGALPTGAALPTWYAATGLTQGPNVQAANACNGFPSGANSCYVFTDSGTYDYLASGTDPAGAVPALRIVTQDNTANAPGGQYELINYFHGYIINPNKPGQTVNLPAAQAFLNYITSPTVQAQVAAYLQGHGNPFTPTASPLLTASPFPATFVARAGKKITVTGTLTNAQPGYPVLSGETVAVSKVVNGLPVSVATGKTDSQGKYSIKFVPPTTGYYEVTTNQIAKVENSSLSPVFGDLLSPAATAAKKITVHSVITQLAWTSQGGQALIRGQVSPGTGHVKATVTLFATPVGSKQGFKKVATYKLAANDANFAVVLPTVGPGTWLVKGKYADSGQVVAAPPRTIKVTVGAKPNTSVSFSSIKVAKDGKVTVSGKVSPGAPASGATVQVLTMKTSGGSPQFGEKTKVKLGAGKTKFTVHFNLKPGFRYLLRLVNNPTGQPPSDSGLKTINVK
jgi:ABC-type tungstate transport system permease subunit